ncbi:MAG TPA: hypothetical protein VGQ80_08725 [Acidimicrobiia bacterium]|nr:hypothetical protein [Acidimicrobiia bacterium]
MSRRVENSPVGSRPVPALPPGRAVPARPHRVGRVVDLRGGELVRYERMIRVLRLLTRLAFVAALAGLLLPDPAGKAAAGMAVAIVVGSPLLRVAWLAVRWYRRGDRRYAAVAVALLIVVGTGSVIALVTR